LEVYEKDSPIPNYEWQTDFAVKGSFVIADTVSSYNIYLVLRHNDAYKYNNIWVNVGLQPPGDSVSSQKVNLKLGEDATGWEGTGMNDIWEVRKILNTQPVRFKRSGIYQFQLTQIMRDNPLRSVMSAGFRVEKQSH
jgi:gliding motility-associated lipoprotein GldH